MQSQVDEISPVMVEVKVEVPWQTVQKELDQAYRKVQKSTRVRGFRPGKVPRKVLKNLVGRSVNGEVVNALVQQGLGSAVDEHSLQLVAVPEVDPAAITEGEPLRFTAKIEVRPKIDEVKLDSLAVERKVKPVTDEAVSKEIESLRQQHADIVTPDPPRPARDGDQLSVALQMSLDGTVREDLSSDDTKVELGQGRLLPEMEEGLRGMEVGEEKAIDLTFPEDYGHPELEGKPAHFVVKLKELQEKSLPDLDDEFAKDLEYESLEAMRSAVRERLETAEGQRADALLKEAIVDKLVDENPVPVPPSLINQELHGATQEMLRFQQMLGQGPSLDEDIEKRLREESERKVRAGLLFGEIARRESLEVTPEEVEAELLAIAERSGKHIGKVRAEFSAQRQQLETRLLENKLLEYLRSKATITEGVVEAESDEEQM
ncbi:MAG: trigger factor [Myxococcales bacterium]|nr:trigger factor [Myxococcales bacterium]